MIHARRRTVRDRQVGKRAMTPQVERAPITHSVAMLAQDEDLVPERRRHQSRGRHTPAFEADSPESAALEITRLEHGDCKVAVPPVRLAHRCPSDAAFSLERENDEDGKDERGQRETCRSRTVSTRSFSVTTPPSSSNTSDKPIPSCHVRHLLRRFGTCRLDHRRRVASFPSSRREFFAADLQALKEAEHR